MTLLLLILVVCVGSLAHLAYSLLLKSRSVKRIRTEAFTSEAPKKRIPTADYTTVFPPSQRHVLGELLGTEVKEPLNPLITESLVKMDVDYRDANPSSRIFSGFTVGEVNALGNFPDYAKLSGVPAPSPVNSFNIDSASPRPYRPFRWAYHQTMCKLFREHHLLPETNARFSLPQDGTKLLD